MRLGFRWWPTMRIAWGEKVAVHVHGVEGMRFAVDAGIDTLEHCPFRAHGRIAYDERLVADMVARDLIVSLAMPATWYRSAGRGDARAPHPPWPSLEGPL